MNKTTKRGNLALSWVLRVFLLLVILFFAMFSLDVFEGDDPLGRKLLGFLIHNVPSLVMIAILIIAWRWENIAGFLLIAGGIAMVFLFGGPGNLMFGTWIMISLPVIVGVLFLVNYYGFGHAPAGGKQGEG